MICASQQPYVTHHDCILRSVP